MNETDYSFGARLAQLRQNAGLSQQGLADQLSVTRQAVSNWEREQTLPDLDTLRSIAQVLGVDLNTLGGSAAPVPKRQVHRGFLAGALALCFCGVFFLGGFLAKQEWRPFQTEAAADTVQSNPLPPHTIRNVTPNGITLITAADGWQELTDLLTALPEGDAGPVEANAELADTFRYFAEQYDFQFIPDYEDGEFTSSWDQVLFWLYKSGISKGGIMSEETVDAAIEHLFGSDVSYSHQSTEHFPITEEGYYPVDAASSRGDPYQLTSLNKSEDGVYEAVLRRKDGSTVTFTAVLEGESLQFQSIARTEKSV